MRTVSEEPFGAPLPPVPVPIGTEGTEVVTAPALVADPVPGAEAPPGEGPAGAEYPGAVPDGAEPIPAALVEAAAYEAMAAALADEACSTGQTV